MTDSSISDNVGTRLLFENERVRVWDLRLAPGESTEVHRHSTDYLYVAIGGGTIQGVNPDGSRRPENSMEDGDVRFREVDAEEIHSAINIGDNDWRNIVVELKT